MSDQTSEIEQAARRWVGEYPTPAPADLHTLQLIMDWRARQAAGDVTPTWEKWAEWKLTLPSGEEVVALYRPAYVPAHLDMLELYGPINERGYACHWLPVVLRSGVSGTLEQQAQAAVKLLYQRPKEKAAEEAPKKDKPQQGSLFEEAT